jgi:hypothetical protein
VAPAFFLRGSRLEVEIDADQHLVAVEVDIGKAAAI